GGEGDHSNSPDGTRRRASGRTPHRVEFRLLLTGEDRTGEGGLACRPHEATRLRRRRIHPASHDLSGAANPTNVDATSEPDAARPSYVGACLSHARRHEGEPGEAARPGIFSAIASRA